MSKNTNMHYFLYGNIIGGDNCCTSGREAPPAAGRPCLIHPILNKCIHLFSTLFYLKQLQCGLTACEITDENDFHPVSISPAAALGLLPVSTFNKVA